MRLRLEEELKRRRGQALVLAALSMLLLALMIALSFNLSHALHEKMRLQQHSDALAYSMGVVEARAFNYFAASNRAIAASLVAMNTLHADMAAASVTGEMMGAAQINFFEIAGWEFLECDPPHGIPHCFHGAKALSIAFKFGKAKRDYLKKAKGVDGSFERAVKALDFMIDAIHLSQTRVQFDTADVLRAGTADKLTLLKAQNVPPKASDLPEAVGALNLNELDCAIDASMLPCIGGPSTTSQAVKGEIMAAVANATRPDWPANRGGPMLPKYLNAKFLNDLMHGIQGTGMTTPSNHKGTAKTIQSASQSELHNGQSASDTGATSGADEHGLLTSFYKDTPPGVMTYKAEVYSNKSGGQHTPGGAHSGQHKFNGIYSSTTCLINSNCFMKFRADADKTHDFGQPSVYSYLSMKLREGDVKKAPWELNGGAKLSFAGPDGEEGTLTLAAGDGGALSKALVYFHRLGAWRDPPNFFEPYWRVKLHPFTAREAAKVLAAGGNSDAAQLTAAPGMTF